MSKIFNTCSLSTNIFTRNLRNTALAVLPLLLACSGPQANIDSTDPYERYLGVLRLAYYANDESIQKIIKFTNDESYLVRESALIAIGKLEKPELAEHALHALEDQHPLVRARAVKICAQYKYTKAVPKILELLKTDQGPLVRKEAARSLPNFSTQKEIIEGLIDAAFDSDPAVARFARLSLEKITNRNDLPIQKQELFNWFRANYK